jgi:hypothetical protein
MKRISTVAFILAATSVLVFGISSASASSKPAPKASIWQFTDGFDSNPTATWSCWASIPHLFNRCESMPGGPFRIPPDSVSMTNAWRVAAISGWSDVGRPVSLSPFLSGRTLNCVAQMRVYPVWTELTGNNFNFRLEVIDSATWTYVSTKELNYTAANRPHAAVNITTPNWIPPRKNIFVRIGVIGGAITNQLDELWVDSLIVQCGYN